MRSILIDRGSDPVVAGTAINARVEDVRIAARLLVGAASAAEAEIASSGFAGRSATPQTPAWSSEALAAARPLGKIIKACNELEAALASPAHMPSPAAHPAMPDERTQATTAEAFFRATAAVVAPIVEKHLMRVLK
jgi:hypothetical protein